MRNDQLLAIRAKRLAEMLLDIADGVLLPEEYVAFAEQTIKLLNRKSTKQRKENHGS